jgi:hypothetical protein
MEISVIIRPRLDGKLAKNTDKRKMKQTISDVLELCPLMKIMD